MSLNTFFTFKSTLIPSTWLNAVNGILFGTDPTYDPMPSTQVYCDNTTLLAATRYSPGVLVTTTSYLPWVGTAVGAYGGARYYVMTAANYATLRGNSSGPTALGNGGDGANARLDFALPNGNIAVLIPEGGRILGSQAGMRGDGVTDDTLAFNAAAAWAVRCANSPTYQTKTPATGRVMEINLEPGCYLIGGGVIPGSIRLTGSKTGSYAGAVILPPNVNTGIITLARDWADGASNATVFEGLRFRGNAAGANSSSLISADDSTGAQANSIYFYDCWFSQSEGYFARVTGNDWKFDGCTFDVTLYNGILLGASILAASQTAITNCTFYDIRGTCVIGVNHTDLLATGNRFYGNQGAGAPMSVYDGTGETNSMPTTLFSGSTFNYITSIAKVNHNLFTISDTKGYNLGHAATVVTLAGGAQLSQIHITDNDWVVIAGSTVIDSTGTMGLTGCVIGDNGFVSSGSTVPALHLTGTNAGNKFGNNAYGGFAANIVFNGQLNGLDVPFVASTITTGAIAAGAHVDVAVTPAFLTGIPIAWETTDGSILPAGLVVKPTCTAANACTIRYFNATSAPITPPTHSLNLIQYAQNS